MTTRRRKINTEGKPWARYLRLSKAEAADEEGLTKTERIALTNDKLDDHLAELTEWMDDREIPYDPEHVYRDPGLSAWKRGVIRPDWDRMMVAAEKGDIAGIGIVALDRFTRDVGTMEDLITLAEKTDVKIGGPRAGWVDLTTYEGITRARGAANQAANESLSTSFRLKEKLASQARKGKPMGGGRAFGFDVVGNKRVIEVPQRPDEVAVIREMASRLLAGEPLQQLAKDMNSRGLRTVRGGLWKGANLGRMLGSARYGGEVELNGKIVGTMPGEPILDRDTYDGVQALLGSRRRGRRPTGRYPYTGLLFCSDCQQSMNGAPRSKPLADGTKLREYRCSTQRGGCGRVIQADRVEKLIGERMVALLSDPAEVADIVARSTELNEARTVQLAKLRAVEARLESLEVKWASGELIQAAYDKAKPILDGQRTKLLAGLDDLTPTVAASNYDAAADWDEMTDDERRTAIQVHGVRIEVTRGGQGQRRFDESRVRFYRRGKLI